jgi:predicted SpoU family rRNA methylase
MWGAKRGRRVVVDNTVVTHEPSAAEIDRDNRVATALRLVERTFLTESLLEEEDRDERLMDLCCDVKNILAPVPVVPGRSS